MPKKRLPKVTIEGGKHKVTPPDQPYEFDEIPTSFSSSLMVVSSFASFSQYARPPQPTHQEPHYKPTQQEMLELIAQRADVLKKKKKSEEEIQIILKDFTEDLSKA